MATILIAEDEPFIVESLTFLLEREGHRVSAVGDGGQVMAAVLARRPDLLVLDAMLPNRNGFDLLRELRRTPGCRRLKVLVLTAKGQASDREEMMALGADAFVTKPFSNRALLEDIAGLLARRPVT